MKKSASKSVSAEYFNQSKKKKKNSKNGVAA